MKISDEAWAFVGLGVTVACGLATALGIYQIRGGDQPCNHFQGNLRDRDGKTVHAAYHENTGSARETYLRITHTDGKIVDFRDYWQNDIAPDGKLDEHEQFIKGKSLTHYSSYAKEVLGYPNYKTSDIEGHHQDAYNHYIKQINTAKFK